MAKLSVRKFRPTPEEQKSEGAVPFVKIEIIEALKAYKAQNPVKYEQKKEALFARYGLTLAAEPLLEVTPDENDKELEALTTKAKKTK